jgi:hypothetical protein
MVMLMHFWISLNEYLYTVIAFVPGGFVIQISMFKIFQIVM